MWGGGASNAGAHFSRKGGLGQLFIHFSTPLKTGEEWLGGKKGITQEKEEDEGLPESLKWDGMKWKEIVEIPDN